MVHLLLSPCSSYELSDLEASLQSKEMRGRSRDKSNMSYTSCPGKHVCSGSPSHATVRTRACVRNLPSHGDIAWPEASNGQYMWVNRVNAQLLHI